MTVKAFSTSLLALVCAATAFAQTNTTPGGRQLPVRSSSLSRSSSASASSTSHYISPTAKSDDLVESPATNVVKGAFGYTLGAIWEGPIPEDAKPDKNGEVFFSVEPKTTLTSFESVSLSVSLKEKRIAAIAAETPRMALAESCEETLGKANEIARELAQNLGFASQIPGGVTNIRFTYYTTDSTKIMQGKLYREFLKTHQTDPDYRRYANDKVKLFLFSKPHIVAGSRYNATPLETSRPNYLQQIWQPYELNADYYPYAGDAAIHFSVRDVEDRTEHTNLISVADLKKRAEEAAKKDDEQAAAPGSYLETLRRRQSVLTETEQAFKDSLYRLSFAEAVEKAKENNPEALLRIALAYANGNDIQQNNKKAREYIEKACELQYGYAQYLYGLVEQCNFQPFSEWSRFCDRCRHFGLNTSISGISSSRHANFAKAVQLFEQAVSNGVSFAQADLEYARGKLNAAEEEEARKNRNAELLKGITGDESQKKEEESKEKGDNTDKTGPGVRRLPARVPRPAAN